MRKKTHSKFILPLYLLLLSFVFFILSFSYFIFFTKGSAETEEYYKAAEDKPSFTTIVSGHKFESSHSTPLLSGKKIDKNFLSESDNLGTISIPFDTQNKSINDLIVFRIKKQGEKKWFYENEYKADQIQNDAPFPFGFPAITDSKNKIYSFQIESLNGRSGNYLSVKRNASFFAFYQFSRNELSENPQKMVQFLFEKLKARLNLFSNKEVFFIGLFMIFPIVFSYILKFLLSLPFFRKIKFFNYLSNFIETYDSNIDRDTKIKVVAFIVSAGFFISWGYHYVLGMFYRKPFPLNTFLPTLSFGDFFGMADHWIRLQFTGIDYGLSYFPSTYLFADILLRLFGIHWGLIFLIFIFSLFLFFYTFVNIKVGSLMTTIQNAFLISFMSYPYLFTFSTGNIEIVTFMLLCLFFLFYKKNSALSSFFLAFSASMKLFTGLFLLVFLMEKKFKEIFITVAFIVLLSILPLLFYDGGFNKGIDSYLNNLKASQQMYIDLMVIGGSGVHYGHSFLNGLRVVLSGYFPPMENIMVSYAAFALLTLLGAVIYILLIEKTFWKKITCLVIVLDLLPYTSTDYKLLYFFIPLFLFINFKKRDKNDLIYTILFSLLLIPKDYIYFNNSPYATLNVVLNPIIMIIFLFLIVFSGIKNFKSAKGR